MKKGIPLVLIGILVLSGFGASAISEKKGINYEIKSLSTSSSTYDDEYKMVIIAPNKFSSYINPLIEHKNLHGVDTFLKTTEDIYNEYEGRDDAEKVKYFIKDAIETNNISYVLLMGGKRSQFPGWHVPARYSYLDDGFDRYQYLLTDLYFSDIYKNGDEFEDWDSNGNGIFGEWNADGKDDLDLTPDVCVGRLPCRNRFEVKIVVDKIIEYENNAYGSDWFNKMLVFGGDTFTDYSGDFPYEGEATCDVAAGYMDGFDITKMYTSTGALTGEDDFIDTVSDGCGFLLTRGKGGTNRVRFCPPQGEEFIPIENKYIQKLKNNGMYPICIFSECLNAKFDVTVFNVIKLLKNESYYYQDDCVPECIAWRMARKNNGGSIATLTNTNLCFGVYGDSNQNGIPDDAEAFGGLLACEVFRLYGEEDMRVLGEIHRQTITDYVNNFPVHTNKLHCKSIQDWILFGDPSLIIGGYP